MLTFPQLMGFFSFNKLSVLSGVISIRSPRKGSRRCDLSFAFFRPNFPRSLPLAAHTAIFFLRITFCDGKDQLNSEEALLRCSFFYWFSGS